MVRARAKDWNINAEIGVMGFSAGGHLASTVGTHWDYPAYQPVDENDKLSSRPDFLVLMYPVISFSKNQHQGSVDALLGSDQTKESIILFSNELQVTSATPPTILIHATNDSAVPVENSLLFYQALKEKGVYAELHTYPYGGHGFSLSVNDPYLHSWTDRVIDFMQKLAK
jgi:acetyl esterase/lipase